MYKIKKQGIAVDIDETLSLTNINLFILVNEKFSNSENLSWSELKDKYRYTFNVPGWNSEEVRSFVNNICEDNDAQLEIDLIHESNTILKKIHEIIPVVAYISTRPEVIEKSTREWLKKHNFPEAPLILRPMSVTSGKNSHAWKASVLKELYPNVLGIIDDNPKLPESLGSDYKGVVFLYDHEEIESEANVISCLTWDDVYTNVLNHFKK